MFPWISNSIDFVTLLHWNEWYLWLKQALPVLAMDHTNSANNRGRDLNPPPSPHPRPLPLEDPPHGVAYYIKPLITELPLTINPVIFLQPKVSFDLIVSSVCCYLCGGSLQRRILLFFPLIFWRRPFCEIKKLQRNSLSWEIWLVFRPCLPRALKLLASRFQNVTFWNYFHVGSTGGLPTRGLHTPNWTRLRPVVVPGTEGPESEMNWL